MNPFPRPYRRCSSWTSSRRSSRAGTRCPTRPGCWTGWAASSAGPGRPGRSSSTCRTTGPPGADEPHTPGWELHLPVHGGPAETVIRKTEDDGFEGTTLEDALTAAGARSLAVCGVMSEMCVLATARRALALDYRVVLPHDAHATYDIPAAPGISEAVPAAMASRVAEWALGDEVEVIAHATDITFAGTRVEPFADNRTA